MDRLRSVRHPGLRLSHSLLAPHSPLHYFRSSSTSHLPPSVAVKRAPLRVGNHPAGEDVNCDAISSSSWVLSAALPLRRCAWGSDMSAASVQRVRGGGKARGPISTVNQWLRKTILSENRGRKLSPIEMRRDGVRSISYVTAGPPVSQEDEEAEVALRMRKETTKEDMEKRRDSVLAGSAYIILYAIGSNLFVAAAKSAAAYITGSSAMLAEVFHSLADACNEALILWGIRRSKIPADLNHPYGFQRERYAWALVSGCGVFFLGCGVSTYHGIAGFLEPHELAHPQIAFAVLGLSLCVEGFTMFKAMRQIQKSAAKTNVSFIEYLRQGADPTAVHVFVEDMASVTGIAIAGTSLSIALMTGNPMWDSAGSMGIGLLLGFVAKFLVKRNVRSIVETSMDQMRLEKAVSILKNDATVKTVSDVKSTSLGPEWARFKAEVHFNGAEVARRRMDVMTAEQLQQAVSEAQGLRTEQELKDFLTVHGEASIHQLAKELARIEAQITKEVPEITHCDLEIY